MKNIATYLLRNIGEQKRKVDSKVIVIDSYNGAIHKQSTKGNSSIISFNSQLISEDLLKCKGVSAGNSLNILTWLQMVCDEKAQNIFPAIRSVFETKQMMMRKIVIQKTI